MLSSRTLETAIGLIFLFVLFSTICASVREGIEAWLKTRATHLERGLRELLNDASGNGLSRCLYEHPLIYSLYRGDYIRMNAAGTKRLKGHLPSYIPTKSFALALMDIVARGPVAPTSAAGSGEGKPAVSTSAPVSLTSHPITMESLRKGVQNLGNEPIARAVLSALDIAQGDLERTRQILEQWFDGTMDRVSGWYRRSTHWIVFAMALALAGALNVNSIGIAAYLYQNDIQRQHFIKQIDAATGQSTWVPAPAAKAGQPSASPLFNDETQLPIGWRNFSMPPGDTGWFAYSMSWLLLVAGWLMTACAATLGAPFWFDVMNKVMIIRSTVKPHEKSPEEASEDRQLPAQPASVASSAPYFGVVSPQASVDRRKTAQLAYDDRSDVDGCGHADDPQTDDKDLPPAQGGMK